MMRLISLEHTLAVGLYPNESVMAGVQKQKNCSYWQPNSMYLKMN